MAIVAFRNRSSESAGSYKEQAENWQTKAERYAKRFNEARKTAPGTVMTWGSGAAFAAGVIEKKLPSIGGIPTDLIGAGVAGYYAMNEDSLEAAGAFVGIIAPRLKEWGADVADKLPNIGG